MDTLVLLTSTRGTWVCRNELDGDPAKGVRGVDGDIGNHDWSSDGGRGDVLHPGVHPVPPVLSHYYKVNSTVVDVTGANDEWTTACRMGACTCTCICNILRKPLP